MTKKYLKNSDTPPYLQRPIPLSEYLSDTGLYPKRVIQKIGKDHKVPVKLRGELFSCLEFAAKEYSNFLSRVGKVPPKADTRKELTGLGKRAASLRAKLEGLGPEVVSPLVRAYDDLLNDYHLSLFGEGEETEIEKYNFVIRTPWDTETSAILKDFDDIAAALELLELLTDRAIEKVPESRSGKPQSQALFRWVYLVSDYWVRILEREYTVDHLSKEPVTPAGGFLMDCMSYLNPDEAPHLNTQMRNYKKTKRLQ